MGDGEQLRATARAAARVDLGGGTLDLWPLYLLHPGSITVNFALDVEARAVAEEIPGASVEIVAEDLDVRREASSPDEIDPGEPLGLLASLVRHLRPGGGLRLRTSSDSPAGAGLGASSALAVAVTAAVDAICGRSRDPAGMVAVARDCETQALGFPAGSQDYWPAVLGGALALHWGVGGCRVETLDLDPDEIASRVALAYTGAPHHSGINNWAVFRARLEGDPGVRAHLEGVREAGASIHEALLRGDWEATAAALAREWSHRRLLGDHVSTPAIDALVSAALEAGALAGKVCGAGGGGCVMFLCREGAKESVEAVFDGYGARPIPVAVAGPLGLET